MADAKKDDVVAIVNLFTKNYDAASDKAAELGNSKDGIDRFYPVFLQLNPNFHRYAEEKKGVKPPSTREEKVDIIVKFLETEGGKATADKLFSFLSKNENFKAYAEMIPEDTAKAEQITGFLRKDESTAVMVIFYNAFSKTDAFKKYMESQLVPETTEEKRANIINFLKQEASDKPFMGKALAAKYKLEARDLLEFDFKEDNGEQVCDRRVILGALLYNRRLLKSSAQMLWIEADGKTKAGPVFAIDRTAEKTPEPSKMTVKPAQVAGSALEALNLADKAAFQSEIKKAAASKEGLENVFLKIYSEKIYSGAYFTFLKTSKNPDYSGLATNQFVSTELRRGNKKVFNVNQEAIINSVREWAGLKRMEKPEVSVELMDAVFGKVAKPQAVEMPKNQAPQTLPVGDIKF